MGKFIFAQFTFIETFKRLQNCLILSFIEIINRQFKISPVSEGTFRKLVHKLSNLPVGVSVVEF